MRIGWPDNSARHAQRNGHAASVPAIAQSPQRGTFLFFEFDDLDTVARQLQDVTPVVPRRKTFYSADELVVREPCGNVATYAQCEQKG